MIPVSNLVKESSRYPRGVTMQADLMRGELGKPVTVPLLSASWELDRTSNTRLSATIEIAMTPAEENQILSVETSRFRMYFGYTSIGYREMVPIGTCRVDDLDRSSRDTVTIKGSGLEAYMIDGRFLAPRNPPYGVSTVEAITDLIKEVLPNAKVYRETTHDRRVLLRTQWEKERWDAITDLADSIEAEVFADYRGAFVIRDLPTPSGASVFRINMGADGVLVSNTIKKNRDRRYNAAVVYSSSTGQDSPPFYAAAIDNDPASPTYFYGDFGQVPRFFASQFFTSDAQCLALAREQLAAALTANKTTSFTCPLMPFLEPGDNILLDLVDLSIEQHTIGKISASMDAKGDRAEMSVDTINSKRVEDEFGG